MTEKEKKVGCPFCSRESNRPNNVVVHIMGQHQGLCKEKISRIRSPVPSVAMREAMLLFMKDKFESDDTIRTLLEENEKLRWAVASLGGRPGTAPIVPPTLMTSSSSSSGYLQPDHFPDTYPQEVGRHPKHPKKEKSEEEEEEADSEDGDTLSSGKKRKASKISSAGPMKAKAKQPSSRGSKKRRVPSEEEEEEEAKEISPPLSEEEGEETVCIVRWHDMVVTILTRYLNWLSAENIEEEEAKDFFFLVPNSCLPGRPKAAGRKGKEKDLAYQTISLQQLRQLFGHSTFTVQEARRFVRFEKLLEELDMSGLALVANKSFIGTVDSSQTQLGERLADKLLSTVDQHEEDAAEFERAVSQEAEEWERRNAVETFKNFLVSMPQSFADVLLTMHPILENITLARVEKSSLQQRVQRIGELLAASKARIASKIADNGMHLGISKRQLELELALSEEMATRAINKSTESDAEEVLRGCLRSFIGMKRVLHSFHQLLRGVYESETKPILEKPTAPKLAPSTGYSSDSSNVYISNVGTPSYSMETTPACQSYSRFDASAKRSYAFTQAMSRLLNAIHLCTPAVDSKAQQQLASAQTSTRQQQPQPRQKQTKVQQQPTPARAVAPYPPQAYMMAPPPFGGFEMGQQYGLLSGQHPPPQPIFYAQPVVPFTPIVSRPVTSSAYPPTANNSPPSSQRSSGATASNKETHKVKTSEKKSAFTSPKRAFSSSTSLDESHALSALQALADTAVHQECRGVYRKTYVFLIALEAFRDKTLASRLGAAEDVHLLETAFTKLPGCHVRTLINEQASKDNIRASFLSDMAGAASNDRVMIFMETQGIIARTSSGEQVGVLCAHETNTADPATGILPSELLEWIPHARHVALFLDAPYAATGLFPFDNPSYPVTWENLLSKLAAQYLWSGERGGTARTGIFLNTLKEAFEGAVFEHYRKDWVKMSELCAWVCDAVFRSTKGRQEPQGGKVLGNSATMGGEGGGEVIFLRPDVSCLPIELSTPDPRTAKKSRGSLTPYVTLDVKEFRYCGFSVVPNSPTPVVVEKYKVMIEDQAHGIIVGETECLDRNSAVAASVEEYIKNLRVKEPSILLSSAKVLSELLKETAGAMYTVTIAVD